MEGVGDVVDGSDRVVAAVAGMQGVRTATCRRPVRSRAKQQALKEKSRDREQSPRTRRSDTKDHASRGSNHHEGDRNAGASERFHSRRGFHGRGFIAARFIAARFIAATTEVAAGP